MAIHYHMRGIKRHNHKLGLIFFFHFFIFNTFPAVSAPAGVFFDSGGTYFTGYYSSHVIIIAGEGRVTIRDQTTHDATPAEQEACKITLLDDHTFFIAAGPRVSLTDGGQEPHIIIDAQEAAHNIFIPSVDFSTLANLWGAMVSERFNTFQRQHNLPPPDLQDNLAVRGIFGGSDIAGNLGMSGERIRWSNSDGIFSDEPQSIEFSNELQMFSMGISHPEIQLEFQENESDRAKTARTAMSRRIKQEHLTGADVYGAELQAKVQAMIEWSNDPSIGGHVSVLIGEPNRPLRWFLRSPACGG
jgi:hypothetical protein